MSFSDHLRRVFSFSPRSQSSRGARKNACHAARKSGHCKPALETLEDRLALSVASSVNTLAGIKDFYIDGGNAYLADAQGTHLLASNVQAVSAVEDPGGYARAAILAQNGDLYEYFDQTKALVYETSSVTEVSAGYAFDAIRVSNELCYLDPYSGSCKAVLSINAVSFSAGEDRDYLPMIAYVDSTGHAYEWRLGNTGGSGYTESLGTGVSRVSAGLNGVVALVKAGLGRGGGEWAYNHYDDPYASYGGAFTSAGTLKFLAAGAAGVSAGTDAAGKAMTDVLFAGTGQVKEFSDTCGVKDLGTGWREVDAGLGGISDLVRQAVGGAPAGADDIYRFQDGCGIKPDVWILLVRNDLR